MTRFLAILILAYSLAYSDDIYLKTGMVFRNVQVVDSTANVLKTIRDSSAYSIPLGIVARVEKEVYDPGQKSKYEMYSQELWDAFQKSDPAAAPQQTTQREVPAGGVAPPSTPPSDLSSMRTVRIILKDGSELVGKIASRDSIKINFITMSGISLDIPQTEIKSMEAIAGTWVRGEFQYADPNQTRLFFAPTGRGLAQGQGYFSAYELFFPFIAYGVTDFFTLAGGISIFPGTTAQLVMIAPRVNFPASDVLHISGGILYINSTSFQGDGLGITYGTGTLGSSDAALTLGLGWGFSGGSYADKPIIVLGGEARLSQHTKLISENWFPPGTDAFVYSFGLRFFGERLAADLAFFGYSDLKTEGFPFFPWLGFAYNFGQNESKMYEDQGASSAPFEIRSKRIHLSLSVGLASSRGTSDYKSYCQGLGYHFEETVGLFSESFGRTSSGSGMSLQGEYSVTDRFSAGVLMTTLGNVIGSVPELRTSDFYYFDYYQPLTTLRITHRTTGYYLIGVYTLLQQGDVARNVIVKCGGGAGVNHIDMQYQAATNNSTVDQGPGVSISKNCFGGHLFATIEQWINSGFSIGLTGSYTIMPRQGIHEITFDLGQYVDYSTSPPQTKSNIQVLPKHEINFSYAKISITTGIHL
jgi:hypothetical protein